MLPDADVSEPELEEEEDHDEEVVSSDNNESDAENHEENPYFRWRKNLRPPNKDRTWKGSFPAPPEEEWESIEYFYRFFTKDLINHIVEQTNIYALQQNSSFRTDIEEVEKFLGCLMKMGIVNMPRYEMYWAQSTRFGPVADVLSRNRFTELKNLFISMTILLSLRIEMTLNTIDTSKCVRYLIFFDKLVWKFHQKRK